MNSTPLTLVEKIATRYAVGLAPGQVVRQGDFITIRPKHVMTHDNTGAVIPKFKQIGATKVHDPRQPVFAIDHDIQNTTPENLGKYATIESFAREHAIDFYPADTGISHQVMVEQGYITPGSMVVGSDSHSNLYGALCCLGTPVVRTDAASLWATGVTWWQCPPVARITLTGTLRPGVVGKDIIIALCGRFNRDEVLNHALEFSGPGVGALTIDQRMSIANMSTEWGALAALFPFDQTLRDYLHARADYFAKNKRPGARHPNSLGSYTRADVDRWWAESHSELSTPNSALSPHYALDLSLDLSSITPHVAGPNDVKTIHALPDIEPKRIKINKAWLMSCVNARSEDLAAAAAILRSHTVAPGVEFYLAAASAEIQARAEADGSWQALLSAGAIPLPPGCGTCIGLGAGTIKAGEVGISATNRNFEGRMGDRNGQVYLASPAIVAASAKAGYICAPTHYESIAIDARAITRPTSPSSHPTSDIRNPTSTIPGFPTTITARAWFLDRDNLNTDGIYAGKHTYNDKLTPAEMANVIFENYDPTLLPPKGGSSASGGSLVPSESSTIPGTSLVPSESSRVSGGSLVPSVSAPHLEPGDIIIGALNFGTGSSREQAATALKFFGIPCVIAASFSETYKRNAFNNGFVCFECPALIDFLRSNSPSLREGAGGRVHSNSPSLREGAGGRVHSNSPSLTADGSVHSDSPPLTEAPGGRTPPLSSPPKSRLLGQLTIDYTRSTLTLNNHTFPFPPLSPVAQELIVAGGAEQLIKRRLAHP